MNAQTGLFSARVILFWSNAKLRMMETNKYTLDPRFAILNFLFTRTVTRRVMSKRKVNETLTRHHTQILCWIIVSSFSNNDDLGNEKIPCEYMPGCFPPLAELRSLFQNIWHKSDRMQVRVDLFYRFKNTRAITDTVVIWWKKRWKRCKLVFNWISVVSQQSVRVCSDSATPVLYTTFFLCILECPLARHIF